ncbi:hypothetical protein CCYN2B_120042 [Capnocytophaga cynodegmi]|uniref:Uncharacterized protein n=1 Tax=Capnocytophaga cynodegmi TaxID=28189 RepID=A0A0B7H547_9FLAO|nr:hypothetical protein CCYN2B_120042 [Capnocytophaga cynodegmi]
MVLQENNKPVIAKKINVRVVFIVFKKLIAHYFSYKYLIMFPISLDYTF